MIIRQMAIKNV